MVIDYILLEVLNTWVWKLMQSVVGNLMLMISPLNWIQPILSFSEWENMLVLKYWHPSILGFFLLLFILLLSILFLLTPIYPTRVLPAFRIVALFNEFYFYKKRLLQFDFVLSLGVMNPLITPVMSIDWMGSIWEVDFDMLKNMDFGNLVDLLSSLRRFDRVYQDWFV